MTQIPGHLHGSYAFGSHDPATSMPNAEKAEEGPDPRLYDALIRAAQHAREMDWPGDEKSLRAAAEVVFMAGAA